MRWYFVLLLVLVLLAALAFFLLSEIRPPKPPPAKDDKASKDQAKDQEQKDDKEKESLYKGCLQSPKLFQCDQKALAQPCRSVSGPASTWPTLYAEIRGDNPNEGKVANIHIWAATLHFSFTAVAKIMCVTDQHVAVEICIHTGLADIKTLGPKYFQDYENISLNGRMQLSKTLSEWNVGEELSLSQCDGWTYSDEFTINNPKVTLTTQEPRIHFVCDLQVRIAHVSWLKVRVDPIHLETDFTPEPLLLHCPA